jgi:hypothetical protein
MDQGLDPKALAAAKLEARQRRRKTLRSRIAIASIVVFMTAWATVLGQAAVGGGSAVGGSTQATTEAPAQDPSLSSLVIGLAGGDDDDEGGVVSSILNPQPAPSSPSPAPVTSSQS